MHGIRIGDYNLGNFLLPNSSLLNGTHIVFIDTDSYAFKNCIKLEEVIIPSSIKDIKTAAFSGCSKLKAIVIPPTVEFLYSHVFQNCKNLEEVVMSCKTHTGDDVFLGCNKATIRLE